MKTTHRTPKDENPGGGGRGAMRRAHQDPLMARMTKAEMAARIAELEAGQSDLIEKAATQLDRIAEHPSTIRLAAGEMTAQEMRTARAVLRWAAHMIRAHKPIEGV